MKLSNTFNRLRWRHWLLLSLLVLVLVIKWSPYLGYIYTLYIYSTIGRILSSFSGIVCHWRHLHRPQHRMGHSLSSLRDCPSQTTCPPLRLSGTQGELLSQDKDGVGKSGRISAVDLRMVLHGLGTQLLAAQHLSAHRHDAG